MANALLYEIRYGGRPVERLRQVLQLCEFPDRHFKPDFGSFRGAKVWIEQSFSNSGDLDCDWRQDTRRRRKTARMAEDRYRDSHTIAPRRIHRSRGARCQGRSAVAWRGPHMQLLPPVGGLLVDALGTVWKKGFLGLR